jgi:endo-1,3(4)-beta-glucanase
MQMICQKNTSPFCRVSNVLLLCDLQDSSREETILRGVQFILKTQEGMNWIVFASEPVTLSYNTITKTTVSAEKQFTGIIRIALVPSATSSNDDDAVQVHSSTGLRRLIYHAGVYPVGGDVSWDFRTASSSMSSSSKKADSTSVATVHFNYATRTMTDNSQQTNPELLMLVLPHHAQLISKGSLLGGKHFDIEYNCIKGRLSPVVGSSWGYDEPLPDIGFDGPLQDWDLRVRTKILEQVDEDLDRLLPTKSENIYGYGKQVARLAQLTHIIVKLGEAENSTKSKSASTSSDGDGRFQKAHDLLWNYLDMLLSGEVGDALLYDSTMGGIVSTNGLSNSGEDFGNGRYNGEHISNLVYPRVISRIFLLTRLHIDSCCNRRPSFSLWVSLTMLPSTP